MSRKPDYRQLNADADRVNAHLLSRIEGGASPFIQETPDSEDTDSHRNAPSPSNACLYGLLGRIAAAASSTTEANPYAVALNALVYMSAGIGAGPFLSVGNTWHHTNVFALHLGRSGRGRKGDASSIIHRIDKVIQAKKGPEAFQVWRTGLSTREGLASLIHDGYKDGKSEVPPINDKRLLVFESEFANVLQQSKRDGNTLSMALRDAFDGVGIKPATKSSRVGVSHPHIAIIAACTPAELRSCMAARELTNGFANRFMMIYAERQKLIPFPVATPQSTIDSFAIEVSDILLMAKADRWVDRDCAQISLSKIAQEIYSHLYRTELNSNIGGPNISPLLERRAPVLLRIASILAICDGSFTVDEQHINAAHAWIMYWQDSVLYVFADAQDEARVEAVSQMAQKILSFLTSRDNASRKEITRDCFSGHAQKVTIDAALDELLSASPAAITVETVPRRKEQGPGSSTKVYRLAANTANTANGVVGTDDQGPRHQASRASPANSVRNARGGEPSLESHKHHVDSAFDSPEDSYSSQGSRGAARASQAMYGTHGEPPDWCTSQLPTDH